MERFSIDRERFARALQDAEERQNEEGGIGTLREKLLHATLKNYFSGENDLPEQKIGRYVADLLGPEGVTEIQTGSTAPLRKKIGALLTKTPVTVVCPLMREKELFWIDPDTAEISPGRKSPKKGAFCDLLPEMLYLLPWIGREDFTVVVFLYDGQEYKLKNGRGRDGKTGAARYERRPTEAVDLLVLKNFYDCGALLPANCPPTFTAAEFSKLTRFRGRKNWAALKFLTEAGLLVRDDTVRPQTYKVVYEEFLMKKG